MNRMPLIISHYTINTGYAKEVRKLTRSLDDLGLRYWVEGIESLGSWRFNSNYCSVQVQRALAQYPDDDILRVDADAVFMQRPVLFEEETFLADVAAHVHNFRWHENELLGGTLFFRNREPVRQLVDQWAHTCMETHPTHRNGDLLQQLLLETSLPIYFQTLPDTYCKIFDLMREVRHPVIIHNQASRKLKREINRKAATR